MRSVLRAVQAAALTAVVAMSAQAQAPAKETQAQLEKEAKITMKEARALAMHTVPKAKVEAGEIEREGGKLIYSFDMKTAGKSGIDEVNIDAMTGKVISNAHETPKMEAKEAKADKAAAKAEAKADKKKTP